VPKKKHGGDKPAPAGETIDELQELTSKLLIKPVFAAGEVADAKLDPGEESPMLSPGTRFGKFEIIRLLGHGGAGEVYQANDTSLQRSVALKILTRVSHGDTERFRREAQLAAKLAHPNLVPIHEIGQENGRHYLSMPYIEGNTIDRTALNTREILRAMREVALAVHYAHSQGIVHRDIKPSNILIDQFGHVYLSDFGVAKQTFATGPEGAHTTDAIMGTPCYMSPEQARGETQYIDARTDVYALGSTLYRLLTRSEPFSGNSPFDILQKVVSSDPPRPSKLNRSLTREFDVVIGKAMEKERERRYPDAHAYADELQRLHDGEPIQASPAPWTYRALRYLRKNRLVSLLIALVAVMMASGAWLLLTYRFESELARRQKRAAEHVTRGRKHTDGVIDLSGRESPELLAKWVELAVNAYDQASEEDPADPTPLILKAATLYWSGDPGAAEKWISRAGAMPGTDADYRIPFLLARIRLEWLIDREPIPLFLVTSLGPRFLHPGWAESAARQDREELKKVFEQARDLARPLADSDEEAHLDYLYCVGAIAYFERRPGQAAESLAASVRGGLRGRDAEHLLGLAYYRDRAFESAVGVFQGLLNVRYRAALARRLLGLALLAHGTARGVFDLEAESYYLDARRILTETVRATPDEAEVLFERGVIHFALGMFREGQGDDPTYMDYRRAIDDLAHAVTIDVRQSVAHRTLGQVWTAISRLQIRQGKNPADAIRKAREHLDEALLLDPQDADAIVFRGHLHLTQALHQMRTGMEPHEEIQRALDQGDQARKLDPELPDARDLRAQGFRRLADYERGQGWTSEENLRRADEELRQALLRVDSNPWLVFRQAQLQWDRVEELDLQHLETGDQILRALTVAERAVEQHAYIGPAQALRARILVEAGLMEARGGRDPVPRWEAAAQAVAAALKSNDRLFEALMARAILNIAWGDYERGAGKDPVVRYEEARVALEEAATAVPGEPELYLTQALLALTRGQYPRAIEAARRCQAAAQDWSERAQRIIIVARRYLDGF